MITQEDARLFRDALGAFATGVTIITAHGPDGHDTGLTANSFNSVSLDPPMVLWSLARNSGSLQVFEAAKNFAVHVLASDQQKLSDRFVKRGKDKFSGLDLDRGLGNAPLLDGCAARFECRIVFRYEGGDHVIFVGEVETFIAGKKPPLIYHGGKYGMVVRHPTNLRETIENDSLHRDLLTYLLSASFHQMFIPVRQAISQSGLNEDEYLVLGALAISDPREVTEVDALLASGGREASGSTTSQLEAQGLVVRKQTDEQTLLAITIQGGHLQQHSLLPLNSLRPTLSLVLKKVN